jgi:hypothetical protein
MNCHDDYDPVTEAGSNWTGSMMAQAARDPLYWACYTVAMQDSIWALGNPDAGDLCLRCHFPEGWLAGRDQPVDAKQMTGSDYDGVHCDFCHKMYDPFFETTFNGMRESDDWIGYWDEAGNTGPSSGTVSQTKATDTYLADRTLSDQIRFLTGEQFFTKFFVPKYSTYTENTGGQYFVSSGPEKRGSYADASANHQMLYSRFHKSKYYCGTCHDVSNSALANLGLSGLEDQSDGTDLITEQYPASNYFHIERTFSEFMLSAYGQSGGASTNPEFQQLSGGINHVEKCQNCHMRGVTGYASNKHNSILRPNESTEHPNSGVPVHDMTGGGVWSAYILASIDANGPVYDPCNAQLLDQGPSVLTLDLNAGESPKNNGAALKLGSDRAKYQLQIAATLNNVQYDRYTGELSFRVQNNTGHKLMTGFPEGRRIFANIKAYASEQLIYEVNPYDYAVGTLKGLSHSSSSPPLSDNEAYIDQLVYEVHFQSDLTGEDETFHAVLATSRSKDNRIPPKGFDINNASERLSEPCWNGISRLDYFSTDEYAGGYDDVNIAISPGAERIEITLYYQGTSREYVEFLRDEINGNADSLSSPTPSGEPNAYVIQSDPFFDQLRAWGDTLWDLWHHNHGLDGSGVAVEGIVPFGMASTTLNTTTAPILCDLNTDFKIDGNDLRIMVGQWLQLPGEPSADIAPEIKDDLVNFLDFAELALHWGEGTY